MLQVGKDELQSHSNRQTSLVSALQSKNTSVTLEAESLRRRLEEVGQVGEHLVHYSVGGGCC